MSKSSRGIKRGGATVVALLCALIMMVTPGAASAVAGDPRPTGIVAPHGALKSSTPVNKSTIARPPTELRLTFTEAPELAVTRIILRNASKEALALGALRVADTNKATVVAPVRSRLEPGVYTVEWEMAGDDGHPIDGVFTFTVIAEVTAPAPVQAAPAEPARVQPAPAPPVDSAPPTGQPAMSHHDTLSMPESETAFDAESGGYVAVRFLLYAALLVVVGAVAFRSVVLTLMRSRAGLHEAFVMDAARRAASVGRIGALVLLAAVLARLAAQSLAMNGYDSMMDGERVSALVLRTQWGTSWLVQVSATLVALFGFHRARGATTAGAARAGWAVAGVAGAVLAFVPAFASHAAAAPKLAPLAMLFDGLHVLGASGWMGSLFLVVSAGIPAAMALAAERRGPAVADLINAFSPTALAFSALLAGTGVFAAWLHIGTLAALWQSEYGNWLLRKLLVLSVVVATGAWNWLRVKPTLGTIGAAARIHRSAWMEVGVAVVVLVITAILVATPPPMSDH